MAGYTKLFHSILASSVWNESPSTRIVWITLLAMADKDGIAEGSLPGLAVFARVPIAAVKKAIARLSAPDPYSRSPDHDGRRIARVAGGWQLLNHRKFRDRLSIDDRREYQATKQREHRDRVRAIAAASTVDMSTLSTHTDPDTDPNAEEQNNTACGNVENRADPRDRVADLAAAVVTRWPGASSVWHHERAKTACRRQGIPFDPAAIDRALDRARQARIQAAVQLARR